MKMAVRRRSWVSTQHALLSLLCLVCLCNSDQAAADHSIRRRQMKKDSSKSVPSVVVPPTTTAGTTAAATTTTATTTTTTTSTTPSTTQATTTTTTVPPPVTEAATTTTAATPEAEAATEAATNSPVSEVDRSDLLNIFPGYHEMQPSQAIWVHPQDPLKSVLFSSSGETGVTMFELPTGTNLGTVPIQDMQDAASGEVWHYNAVDIVYAYMLPHEDELADLLITTLMINDGEPALSILVEDDGLWKDITGKSSTLAPHVASISEMAIYTSPFSHKTYVMITDQVSQQIHQFVLTNEQQYEEICHEALVVISCDEDGDRFGEDGGGEIIVDNKPPICVEENITETICFAPAPDGTVECREFAIVSCTQETGSGMGSGGSGGMDSGGMGIAGMDRSGPTIGAVDVGSETDCVEEERIETICTESNETTSETLIGVSFVRSIDLPGTPNSIAVDGPMGSFYVVVEDGGCQIIKHDAEPNDRTERFTDSIPIDEWDCPSVDLNLFFDAGDAGFLVASTSTNNDVALYDRINFGVIDTGSDANGAQQTAAETLIVGQEFACLPNVLVDGDVLSTIDGAGFQREFQLRTINALVNSVTSTDQDETGPIYWNDRRYALAQSVQGVQRELYKNFLLENINGRDVEQLIDLLQVAISELHPPTAVESSNQFGLPIPQARRPIRDVGVYQGNARQLADATRHLQGGVCLQEFIGFVNQSRRHMLTFVSLLNELRMDGWIDVNLISTDTILIWVNAINAVILSLPSEWIV